MMFSGGVKCRKMREVRRLEQSNGLRGNTAYGRVQGAVIVLEKICLTARYRELIYGIPPG